MKTYTIDDFAVSLDKEGADRYVKISYPVRYGVYREIKTPEHTFQFNLNNEIKTIQGRRGGWLEAAEWLKRTVGGDWAYFSAGGYTGAHVYTGEYYVPCLSYDTNAVLFSNRFNSPDVDNAFSAWHDLRSRLCCLEHSKMEAPVSDFIARVAETTPEALEKRARRFHEIIGGVISVLPPDVRHVEYDVIPVNVADGCLYNCRFCRVKSGKTFRLRSKQDILGQISALKDFYGPDLVNYNSIFLGNHDALFAGEEALFFSASKAYEGLEIGKSRMKEPRLFLFGSVDSMLRAPESLFSMLNRLPFYTYINLGLESADAETFRAIGKPLSTEKVIRAFRRMIEVNRGHANIEVSANFVYGANLPQGHLPSIVSLTREHLPHFHSKGAIYVSPLEDIGSKAEMLSRFMELKKMCRLPCYIYLIQRL
jgi:hypothetical protein